MYGFYYCAGCHRRCRGSANPCLDCIQALEILSQNGFILGGNEGLEWGISHHPSTSVLPILERTSPYRATKYLSSLEEDQYFTPAYERGFRSGMRLAKKTHNIFRAVLKELLLDVGRRQSMFYCTVYVLNWLERNPLMKQSMDFNVLKEINRFF